MLPIRSEQYLLHTDDERAELMRQRQERVNTLLDLGCRQETIDQADARVLEIDEANTKIAAGAVSRIHDSIMVDFENLADARFAASQAVKRFVLNAPDVGADVKIVPDFDLGHRWIKPMADAEPRGLRFWSGEPGFSSTQPDYNALEQRVLAQSLEAMRRLPKHAVSHSFDFGCRCTMVRDFLVGERPLKRKHTGKAQLRGDVKTVLASGVFDGAMVDAEGAALAGVEA